MHADALCCVRTTTRWRRQSDVRRHRARPGPPNVLRGVWVLSTAGAVRATSVAAQACKHE
eukprot:NODE_29547_length_443_cov_2.699367.p3 GENE.NODE_29547_length_443_cov_2.699367~~NODE_29547_length_443_cov_2.699367.p3  ORF type:complete len:60 (+),score=3.36 NODE_29547_length_443_cov_2.699367:69-248(+)